MFCKYDLLTTYNLKNWTVYKKSKGKKMLINILVIGRKTLNSSCTMA